MYNAYFNDRTWRVEAEDADAAFESAVKIICPAPSRRNEVKVAFHEEFVVTERVFGLGGETWDQEHGRFATHDQAQEAAIELETLYPGIWINNIEHVTSES